MRPPGTCCGISRQPPSSRSAVYRRCPGPCTLRAPLSTRSRRRSSPARSLQLTISATASPVTAVPGGAVHYKVSVTNSGSVAYTGATFTDSLRDRDALLASLRRSHGAAPEPSRQVIDVPAEPLAGCLDAFWPPGLSTARLRRLGPVPATAPDLLLRMLEPPAIRPEARTCRPGPCVRVAGGS